LSNLLEFPIEKSNFSYTSSAYGAAFAAGLAAGIYTDLEELRQFRQVTTIYKPDRTEITRTNNYETEISQWERTVDRFIKWNNYNSD
jgi:glycerol kinase